MAYIITCKNKVPNWIAKDLNELKIHPQYILYQNNSAGYLIEISDQDYNQLATDQKVVSSIDDNLNVTFVDKNITYKTKDKLDEYVSNVKERIEKNLNRNIDGDYTANLLAYKQVLDNLDTSSISFPLNMSLEQYLLSNNQKALSLLQLM